MADSNTPSTGGIGLTEAADRMAAILAGPEPGTSDAAEAQAADGATEEAAPQSTEPEETTEPAGEVTAEDGAGEGDEAVTDEVQAEAEQERRDLVTVKIDGKEERLPLDEVIAGYSRNADYTRKTQQLSEQRKTAETELEAARVERVQYAQMLSALQQQLTQLMPQEPDWNALYNSDPLEYVRQRDVWRERNDKLVAAQAEQQRLYALQVEEQRSQVQNMVTEGRKQLLEKRPEWKKPETWEADRAKLINYGQSAGYSEGELMQATDPRAILILDKARRYDELVAKRPKPAPRTAPPAVKAGGSASVPRPTSEVTKAKQRLAKTGSVRDAAAIFEKLI